MRAIPNEWPSRRVLLAVAAALAAADLVLAATQVRTVLRVAKAQARQPMRLVRDADLDPLSYFVPTQALAAAAGEIPPDATYAVVVGDDPPVPDPQLVRIVFDFWLAPRRATATAGAADWVIAYHRPSERAGVPYTREVGVGPSINLLKVAR